MRQGLNTITDTNNAELSDRDRDCIENIFQRYQEPLHRYLLRLLPSEEDAKEALQETYLRAARRYRQHNEHSESNDRNFLFTIAHNLARDYYRQHNARNYSQHISTDIVELASTEPQPDAYIDFDDAKSLLIKGLKNLKPKYRHVFIMHRFLHMTYAEIAESLKISTRTVERYMVIALEQCHKQLQDYL